ncbi:X-Pro aminopeptidase [Zhengella mangrovi]|uniref:X-Pro aminopeptidase n=1 Tax=Zhengella mangrovi TaxID=1982044 RepID=A0A2G1QQQ6_9HYPH|nr:aminopeptidase P family protein [Zhengella mangrovi]PHP67809.1 X-Pro aminopeptidase [Zhengella mangrovi]
MHGPHFQSFESASDAGQSAPRMQRLRAILTEWKIDGVLVPRSDEHQGEYVAPYAERLSWLTGFTGSAGVALAMAEKALIFVDGRYTEQVRLQTDAAIFGYEDLVANPPASWIEANWPKGARLGIDPWLHTIGEADRLRQAIEKAGGELVMLDRNPVDAVRTDRPAPPLEPVVIHPLERAGVLARDKLAGLAAEVAAARADECVITDPSSLAWMFNIRGSDVPHTPLALGFGIVSARGNHQLFMDKRKMSRTVEAYLTQLCDIRPPSELDDAVVALAKEGKAIGLDPQLAAEKLRLLVTGNGGQCVAMPDPARLPRACKNATELQGSRAAHHRDGVAMARFLAWLDRQEPGTVTETSAVTALESARAQAGTEAQMPLKDISFDTISGAGPNGSIMHYRVTNQTSRTLVQGELYLVDSGGQYEDGTTDITRTVPVGEPTGEMRERYTIVLKGLISVSTIRFPAGTRGCDIDPLARAAHWKAGIDFAHGTGHGVGSYLAVHEGPQRIAKSGIQPLKEGMILSNEPGYYKPGHYGIRLENLIAVTPLQHVPGGDIPMHGFETLTLCPFDRRLIVSSMLTREEVDWLDAYHARVEQDLGPALEGPDQAWLKTACAPLDRPASRPTA